VDFSWAIRLSDLPVDFILRRIRELAIGASQATMAAKILQMIAPMARQPRRPAK
jgi:hypothetical protein